MNTRNYACRITTDVKIKGNDVVVMENESLRLTILVGQGSDIIELLYKPKDIDFMWRSPVPFHKKSEYISSTGDSFANYLDHNSGGWQEILPNGGTECYYKGANLGMHGEISNVPWEYRILKDTEEEISIEFHIRCLRSPFDLVKTITLKSKDESIYIDEILENLAEEEMELMWGHHPTLGAPFLDSSCQISINAGKAFTLEEKDFPSQRLRPGQEFIWPKGVGVSGGMVDMSKMPAPGSNTADMIYFGDFPKVAEYGIYNLNYDLSFTMQWDGEQFPYCWLWQVAGGSFGYPWYGRTYNMAIEPWTSYPSAGLQEAIKNGSSLKLEKRQSITSYLRVIIHQGKIKETKG